MDEPNLSGIAPIVERGGQPIMASGFWGSVESPVVARAAVTMESPAAPQSGAWTAPRQVASVLDRLRWRLLFPVIAFACGFAGFALGVGVTERPEVANAHVLERIYYTLGLFIFGGMDLGVPTGGPLSGRILLWTAYFLAPAITASAVIEATLRLIAPEHRWMRNIRGHVVVAGSGRLATLYLTRLREVDDEVPIVVITPPDSPRLELPREMGIKTASGDIRSDALLERLHIKHARRVMLLTEDDFTNLDAAQKIMSRAPQGPDVVAHVADLGFMRSMAGTRLARRCTTFNGHQIAATHLVQTQIVDHFNQTEPHDLVILAGFGRFGETILSELQTCAAGKFDQVIIIDMEAERRAMVFDEQIGFTDTYRRKIIAGDLRDPSVWHALGEQIEQVGGEPVFVLGSGDDRTNLRTAMWLAGKYPKALVIARSEARWTFAEDVSREAGIATFSVAELVAASMPDDWFELR